MASLHVLAIPFPAQGHVIPLMELSQCLAVLGFRVTFVNSEFDHRRVLRSLPGSEGEHIFGGRIRLVSIPDGLEPGEDRNDIARLCQVFLKVMPGELERLISELNERDGEDKVSGVIADISMSWAFEVAKKMGIKKVAAFWPASAALLAVLSSIPKLVEDGVVDENGTPLKQELISLDPTMPGMNPLHFSWTCMGDLEAQKILFNFVKSVYKFEDVEWLLCNSSIDLESGTFKYMPRCLPVGPLLASNRLGSTAGHFWPPEDAECLDWLDHQPPLSVIYVAFGSITVFNPSQFEELRQGLGMTGMPFLWVIRPDNATTGKISVPSSGKVVGWAPQQEVLRHPSVACFLSHCGWNSTVEGVSNGVPFLCWPYFCDQFFNETYICDVWKVGVRLDRDESGIVRREEIVGKVEELLGSSKDGDGFRKRASEMKEKVINGVKEGGRSYQNHSNFVGWLKASKD